METKFNFNSQVCTDKNQSEHLLALGLKKETADCFLMLVGDLGGADLYTIRFGAPYDGWTEGVIPAWSLGRLVEIINKCNFESFESDTWRKEAKKFCRYILVSYSDDLIETSIEIIETLIQKRYFNKEYLV